MTDALPRYRYRGNVPPSASVKRPARAYRNAASSANGNGSGKGTSATLDIFDVIDSFGGWWGISAAEVDAALAQIGDVDTLYVRVNSPGGEATEGVAIANLIRAHAAAKRTTVYGLAASAASVIAISGDTVSMAPGSMMMVHEASGFAYGNADDMRSAADAAETINDSYAALYALKSGGTADEWRAVMGATKWYSAQTAVDAKLADAVGIDPQLPAGLPPVEEDDEDEPDIEIEIDVEISPAARAAARRFDLSMLPNAPAALATQTPAEPPETQHNHEEAVTMTETEIKALRERLGLAEDADASAINAKLDELEEQATKPDQGDKPIDAKAAKAALEADGKVVISQTMFDEIKAQAADGRAARTKQLQDERDETIQAAVSDGKISRDRAEHWRNAWDKDPEGTKADLESLEVRFPVAKAPGVPGGDSDSDVTFSDDEAAALGALAGVSKEGLLA